MVIEDIIALAQTHNLTKIHYFIKTLAEPLNIQNELFHANCINMEKSIRMKTVNTCTHSSCTNACLRRAFCILITVTPQSP